MGYYVKYKELQSAQNSMFTQINQWSVELENAKQKIQAVAQMEEIKGEAANSIKSYIQEIHIPLIGYLQQLLTEYIARMLIYGNEYYKLDTKLSAKIAQDRLEEQITHINTGTDTFQTIESSVSTAVGMAAGLANVSAPSGERITGSYERLTQKATKLMNDVGDCEYGHLSSDFVTIEEMLSNILQIVRGQSGKGNVTITAYQAGSIAEIPAFKKLQETASKQSADLEGSTKELEDAINGYTKRQQEKDLADQKTKEGQTQILEGVLIAVGAVASAVAIVVTLGAATPVVVGAFAVATTSGLYGLSTANEGVNNVMLGISGDGTTVAMNPIRDTLFASNPELYYTIGNVSTMTCTLAVPIGGAASIAVKAGTSVTRAIAVEGGKIAISSVAGSATSDVVYKKTNNELFAMLAGMGVGSLAYGGMTKYDSAKNISGYHTKATVENVAKNANVLKDTDNYKSFRDLMSPEDVARYDKYWSNVENGKYQMPYGMTDLEYYQYLKGLSKVDSTIKGGGESVQHAVGSANQAQSVLDGINPKYFNTESRFGGGFYVGGDSDTIIAELAEHGNTAKYAISYDMNLKGQKVLDLTNPQVASEWKYVQNLTSTDACQEIGAAAKLQGYNVIKFQSYRGDGINCVIYNNFEDIVVPRIVTPVE